MQKERGDVMKRFFWVLGLAMLTSVSTAHATITTFTGTGDIGAAVASFQAALGNPLNGNAAGPLSGGRRQINWDAGIVPFDMPGNFFNNAGVFPPTRGAVFSTPGTGFGVSNDGTDNEFDSINATYPDQFQTFSAPRLFSAIGSNVVDVNFFVPATDTAATVQGFGAIFTDVDITGQTQIEFFGLNDELLNIAFAPVDPQGLSFVGVTFTDDGHPGTHPELTITRVRITTGTAAFGPDDNPGQGIDIVAIDDLLYSEPVAVVPEPSTAVLGLVGLVASLLNRRRRVKR